MVDQAMVFLQQISSKLNEKYDHADYTGILHVTYVSHCNHNGVPLQ